LAESVGIFLDYENVHRTAHNLYARFGFPIYETVVDPLKIAERLIAKRSRPSTLAGVWVYRGRPVPTHQPIPASANDIQAEAWSADARVHLVRRDLKYEWPYADQSTFVSREKGIDVALAVGLTEQALDQAFDAAIVFSGDTDLLPALELVFGRRLLSLEIAAWVGQKPLWFPTMLNAIPSRKLPYCHFLTEQDFVECRDFSSPPTA
jgi:uncharacterized LabA/DUF88 family protein